MLLFTRFLYLLCLCIVVGCSSSDMDSKDAIILRLGAEPSMLNPILSTDSPSSSVNGYVFSGLLKVNPDMSLSPDLASSVEVLDEGRRYRFVLRENVVWHDGKPFTAHDVKFTFDKILDSATNTVRRSDYVIEGVPVQFNVISDYVLDVVSVRAFAPLMNRLTMGIIPKHIFEYEDINVTSANRQPVGTGPFVFDRWETGQYVVLKKNQSYYGNMPMLETVLLKIIPDNNTALVSFEKEDIYACSIPGKDFQRITQDDQFKTYQYYDLSYTYLGFNLKHPYFKNIKVRQAVAMAINKQSIVDGVLRGYGMSADLPTSPEMWTYPADFVGYDYDVSKSELLLAEAGFYKNESGQLIHGESGEIFKFTIITNKGNKDREKAAEIIQQNLTSLGMDVSIQLMEWSSFISIVNDRKDPKPYDAVILGWSLGLDPDGYAIWHSSQYPNGFNFVAYENNEVDRLLQQARVEMNRDVRIGMYQDIYKHIAYDVPYVFLYYPESLVGFNRRVSGLSAPGPAGLMNPIESIYLTD